MKKGKDGGVIQDDVLSKDASNTEGSNEASKVEDAANTKTVEKPEVSTASRVSARPSRLAGPKVSWV